MVYEDIHQIFKDGKRLVDDFTNADLSHLNLSSIPKHMWEGATFHNTNLKGTNIKFNPKNLKQLVIYNFINDIKYQSIEDCNFEGCDLSYLETQDLYNVIITGCNFKNTGFHVDFSDESIFKRGIRMYHDSIKKSLLSGVILPDLYQKKEENYWTNIDMDNEFVKKNPKIKLSSAKLMSIMKNELENIEQNFHSMKDYEKIAMEYRSLLTYDQQGFLKRFYQVMKPYFQDFQDESLFFAGKIKDTCFEELDLTSMPVNLYLQFHFFNCDIKKLKLSDKFQTIQNNFQSGTDFINRYRSKVEILEAPVSNHDWNNNGATRLINSPITFQTNLYLELKRICNMNCTFCRNNGLDSQKYRYDSIVKNLKIIYEHINNIVIGGGEPTLLLGDLKTLKQDIIGEDYSDKFQIITNGSLSVLDYRILKRDYILYISRHAIDDKENRSIFGDSKNLLLSANDLSKLIDRYENDDVLCCTCFKGGIDSKDKMIDYIKFAWELGYHNILFQTLHQEENFENSLPFEVETINESEFPKVLSYLEKLDFSISKPIYSTSGYELHLASNQRMDMNLSFKEYKDSKYIEKKWYQSPKRCFDLSMAPNGDIYESWDQQQKPIKVKKR